MEQRQQGHEVRVHEGPVARRAARLSAACEAGPESGQEERIGAATKVGMEMATEPVPDLRRSPVGGGDVGAAQYDPFMASHYPYPVEGNEGDLTLVAVFEDAEGAGHCARDLERRGFEVGLVTRRGDGPEQGIRPGNVITGPGYGLSAPNQSPPRDRPMGGPVAVGATLGGTAGLFWATYFIPPLAAPFATGSLVSTLIGAGLGAFVGGLFDYGAREKQDDASMYAGQVRHGGAIVLARVTEERADEARRLIGIWNPLEIRVQ